VLGVINCILPSISKRSDISLTFELLASVILTIAVLASSVNSSVSGAHWSYGLESNATVATGSHDTVPDFLNSMSTSPMSAAPVQVVVHSMSNMSPTFNMSFVSGSVTVTAAFTMNSPDSSYIAARDVSVTFIMALSVPDGMMSLSVGTVHVYGLAS